MSRRHGFFDYTDGGPHEESLPDEEPACIGCGGAVDLDASWNEGLDGGWMCESCWKEHKATEAAMD